MSVQKLSDGYRTCRLAVSIVRRAPIDPPACLAVDAGTTVNMVLSITNVSGRQEYSFTGIFRTQIYPAEDYSWRPLTFVMLSTIVKGNENSRLRGS